MKELMSGIRQEFVSRRDNFNKLQSDEKAAYIVVTTLFAVLALGEVAYEVGDLMGSKLGALIV